MGHILHFWFFSKWTNYEIGNTQIKEIFSAQTDYCVTFSRLTLYGTRCPLIFQTNNKQFTYKVQRKIYQDLYVLPIMQLGRETFEIGQNNIKIHLVGQSEIYSGMSKN